MFVFEYVKLDWMMLCSLTSKRILERFFANERKLIVGFFLSEQRHIFNEVLLNKLGHQGQKV